MTREEVLEKIRKVIREPLPRTATGKIKRWEIQQKG